MVGSGIAAVVIGYLLGSIPSAYIAGRLLKGIDIRRVGGGNVGARNTFRQVGRKAGIAVAILDIGKGAVAVVIAHRLIDVPLGESHILVLATGFAAIVGHIWSLYLRFTGGNGLATTLGVVAVLMPRTALIAIALIILLIPITRNPVLSTNIGLLSVPFSAWLLEKSGQLVLFSLLAFFMIALHFLPTARAALVEAGSKENLLLELLRRNKGKKA